MKKILLFAAAALMSAASMAQEVSITPSLDDNFEPAFPYSADESYFYIYMADENIASLGLPADCWVYMGPDSGNGRNLWYWFNISNGDNSGENPFGGYGGYMSWRVSSDDTWSGLGYNVGANNPMDLHWIDSDYSFHFAVRSTSKQSFDIEIVDGNGTEAHLVLGQTAFDGHDPIGDFERDGEWYDVEVPMAYLEDQFEFTFAESDHYADKNYLVVLLGGVKSSGIDFDACFFHGPKVETSTVDGIESLNAGTQNAAQTIYNLAGQQTGTMQRGLNIVRRGDKTQKIFVK